MTPEERIALLVVFAGVAAGSFLAMSMVRTDLITATIAVCVGLIAAVSAHRDGAGQ